MKLDSVCSKGGGEKEEKAKEEEAVERGNEMTVAAGSGRKHRKNGEKPRSISGSSNQQEFSRLLSNALQVTDDMRKK